MDFKMIAQLLGGLEGLEKALLPLYPKLESLIQQGLKIKEAQYSLSETQYDSLGYSLVNLKGKKLAVIVLGFRFREDGTLCSMPLEYMGVTDFIKSLLDLAKTAKNESG